MKFSGVITNDRSDVYAKGQKSKDKVTEVKTQISRFATITPLWFHIWWWNDAWHCLGVVPYWFSRSSVKFQGHTVKKKSLISTQIGRFRNVSPVWIHRWLWMMHKDWSSIEEVPYSFSRLSVKFQGHRAKEIFILNQNWDFSDCNSSLNSQMAMKWRSNLEVA